jgi:hypothetical protein
MIYLKSELENFFFPFFFYSFGYNHIIFLFSYNNNNIHSRENTI